MAPQDETHLAFIGDSLLVRGTIYEVTTMCKQRFDSGETQRIAIFEDESGHIRDVDFSGDESAVLKRLDIVVAPVTPKRRGRPKLGVNSREVGLLPRHWKWLAEQRGGASASLRRLVDHAQKNESGESVARRAVNAAHRFMWDIAGDQPNFEEATRHLFSYDLDHFASQISNWPDGIREQLIRYQQRAQAGLDTIKSQS